VGVGGELAATQFNAILDGIAPLRGLSTRFGTTSEGTLRTSIVYELDDNLTALASYEGAPSGAASTTGTSTAAPGGAASQRTGKTELSVDWRFHRNWSLRGTVGVGGAQSGSGIVDLLWQYRY
jgi:translocation and assembly module TamB